ncbi:MAG: zinc-ribbon domain-containing protein [Marinosulfonomonas sp.]
MRLICPNCGAQYEVDDSVIPENGRDVQCSNCGHTWYQRSANSPEEPAAPELEAPAPEDSAEPAEDIAADAPEPEAEPEEFDAPEPENQPEPEEAERPKPRGLDDGVASILQQEAEREVQERANDAAHTSATTDLGLDDLEQETDATIQKRMARLRGIDEDHGAAVAAAAIGAGQRKDLLPDIEELNSSLTASAQSASDGDEPIEQDQRRRSGFRLGFVLTIAFFAVLALAYIYAPKVVEMIPGLEGLLTAYVDWVNMLRSSVDSMMQRAVDRLTTLVSQFGGDEKI